MKKTLSILAILSIIAFGMTACFSEEEETAPEEMTTDTLLDDKLFEEAVDGLNEQKCEKIASTNKKEECQSAIQDLAKIEEAKLKADKSLCDEITHDRYKEYCLEEIETVMEAIEYKENLAKDSEVYAEAMKSAKEAGDFEACEKIISENWKYHCQSTAITNPESSTTQTDCEQIPDAYWQQKCKNDPKWTN